MKREYGIGRTIITGGWEGNRYKLKEFFPKLFRAWPKNHFCEILMTPANFIEISSLFIIDEDSPCYDQDLIFRMFKDEVEKTLFDILTPANRKILRKLCRYFVAGIKVIFRKNYKCEKSRFTNHILAIDTSDFSLLASTGMTIKSGSRTRYLAISEDVRSHFVRFGEQKVVLLGGSDLAIFRSGIEKIAEYDNLRMIREFKNLLEKGRPDTVLHLEEAPYQPAGYQRALSQMLKNHDSIKNFAGSFTTCSFVTPESFDDFHPELLELSADNDVLNILYNSRENAPPLISENCSQLKIKRRRQTRKYPANIDQINLIGISSTGRDFMNWAQNQFSKDYPGTLITTSEDYSNSETPVFCDPILIGQDLSPRYSRDVRIEINESVDLIADILNPDRTNVIIASPGDNYTLSIIMILTFYAMQEKIKLCAFLIDPINADDKLVKSCIEDTTRYLWGFNTPFFQFSYLQFLEEYPDIPILTGTDKIYRSILSRIVGDPLKGLNPEENFYKRKLQFKPKVVKKASTT
ncbi:MAG: hypothetical protein AB1403_14180 [Candidatus Riflebacteria bacterium]